MSAAQWWGVAVVALLWAWAAVLATATAPPRHRTTDPACTRHRRPGTWWQQWRYERGRGRSCRVCVGSQ